MDPTRDNTGFRAVLGLLGSVTGLSLWALGEFVLGHLAEPRLELALASVTLAFFWSALMLSGPMLVHRALLWACGMAIGPPALLCWASFRYMSIESFVEDPFVIVAFAVLLAVPLPFVVAADRRAFLHYPTLFDEAWRLVIRSTAAAVFLGVFWGVYMICNLLLSLVGIRLLDQLVDQEPFLFGMSGLVGGLALAVLFEMRRYLSPLLLLKLLQLLLIPVTAVVVVFVVRVPLQGMGQVFSGLSAAATLLAMTFGLATLITSALDCESRATPKAPLSRWTIQIACLLMPLLALLASYAVWLRVEAYGWTPQRVAAASICALGLTYGLLYSLPVVARGAWDTRIRRANTVAALVCIALSAVSLTPILNAQAISARSQLVRFEAGMSDAAQLPLRDMARNWGVAGQSALTQLQDLGDRDLQLLVEDALHTGGAEARPVETAEEQRDALRALMPRVPDEATWPTPLWDALPEAQIASWLSVCRAGADRCVAVIEDVDPTWPGDEALVLLARGPAFATVDLAGVTADGSLVQATAPRQAVENATALVRAVRAGEFQLASPERKALSVGGQEFFATGN